MRQTMRIGAGVFLALLLITCTDKNVTGPARYGSAALDLRAFASAPQPGMPDIPLDSIRVTLVPVPGSTPALDTVMHVQADTFTGDSLVLHLNVSLQHDSEEMSITVVTFGAGLRWYVASDTVPVTTSHVATPHPLARYVGPGAGATSVTLGPRDTTVTGGQVIQLRAVVDSGATPLTGVPVGFRVSDSTKATISSPPYPGFATIKGAAGIRDSLWVYAEIPTHLRDSTRIHIVPPPSQLKKISGDSQTVIVNGTTATSLTVRVEDALNGGSPGVPVTWTVTQGTATLTPPTPVVSDTGGNAGVTVTPSSLGTVKVQAVAAGLTGSPITFTVNVLAGIVHQVIVSPKVDTLAAGSTFQFTATLKDSLGNVISSVKPVWISSNPAVATVDSTGLATGLAGDSTYIIAAAGGHADTAHLFVRVPSKVALSPSDTVITSIGDSVHLTGVVLTNFGDTVKSGVAIRFTSATQSVVTVGATTGEAHLVGAGNGVVLALDTFRVIVPGTPPDTLNLIASGTATLRVNQKVFGIVNNPPDTVVVGLNGQSQIRATAIDKNGYPVPGKVFGWVSRNPTIASVNQSGVVTGLAVGAGTTFAVDTLVDSLTVIRDSTVVSVVPSPPPVMRWAFDTLAIGNGGNTTVTVSLNVPSAAGTVMQIVSLDTTRVKPTQNRIAIGTGGANASVTLQGLAATLTPVDVIAQDSAGVYKPDTLRVIVVSTIFFSQVGQTIRSQDFYLNQNETLNGQVFLSDPAPAGGLGVTFVYAKGFTTTSPTTVVIPAGQLEAPVQFIGLGAGIDSVIPSSGAFVGKFSYLHVAKDTLIIGQPYPYTGVVGLGQTEQPYAQITYSMDHPLPFTIAVTPAIGTVTPNPDTILVNTQSRYFTVTGTSLGTATITVSASNWLSTTVPLIVTPPQLIAGGLTSMVAGNPSLGNWNAYSGDTTRYTHPVVLPLTVHAVSRDTTVVKVVADSVVIAAGQSYNNIANSLFAQPGAGGDSTWIVETAPGYKPDSFLVRVTKPTMTAAYNYPTYDGRVALNTTFPQPVYVQIPYARTDTFAVVLHHTNQSGPQAPDTLFIPKGQTIGYLTSITGVTVGVDTVTIDTVATKPGYVLPAGVVWVLHVDPLHVKPYNYPTSLVTISQPSVTSAYAYDSVNGFARALNSPMTVTLALSRPNVVTLDSTKVTIPTGSAYANNDSLRVAVGVNAPDSTRILTTAPGSSPDSGNFIKVAPTPLTFNIGNGNVIGRGLRSTGNYVYLPAAAPNTVTVALGRIVAGKDSMVPLSVTIPKGQSSSTIFDIWAFDSIGTDTITASAPGFVTGKGTVFLVRDTLRMAKPGSPVLTTAPPFRLFVFVFNTSNYSQRPFTPLTLTVTSSDPTIVSIDSGKTVNGALDTATALVDTTQQQGIVRLNFVGPGVAYVKATAPGFGADSFAVTVTGPSLSFYSSSLTVGTQQLVTQYVTVQNPPATPVTVTLQRSDSTAAPGSQVFGISPTVLTIPAGQYQSNVDTIVGQNIGVAQLLARAPNYGPATATIQVGKPQLVTTSSLSLTVGAPPTGVGVNAEDQSLNTRYVTTPVTVTATVADPTVATVDSVTRVIQAGTYTAASPFRFSGLKKGPVQAIFSAAGYKPDTMLITVDTGTISLGAPFSLGAGEQEQGNVYLPYVTPVPITVNLSATNPAALTVPASVIIPANQSSVSYTMVGAGVGTSQINAAAAGFKNATPVAVIVSAARLVISATSTGNAGQGMSVTVYAEDTLGSIHAVASPVSVTLASNAGAHAVFASNPVTILMGSTQASTIMTFDTAGVFNVTATAAGFETGSQTGVTVQGAEIKVGVGNALSFTPGLDTIPVGKTVTWIWDATNTNSHGVSWQSWPGAAQPNNSITQTSGTYSWTFNTPGTYTYWCTVHTTLMTGTIVVQ